MTTPAKTAPYTRKLCSVGTGAAFLVLRIYSVSEVLVWLMGDG